MNTSANNASQPVIRLIIVDDHIVVRAGLRMLINHHPGFEVVGEAGNAAEALEVGQQPCDVILLDLDLRGEDGGALIGPLNKLQPQAKILILTGMRDLELARRVTVLGARGIVLKEHATEALLKAIKCVYHGELWMDRSFMANMISDLQSGTTKIAPEIARINSLTPREREVVELIGQGLKNKEIARRLFVSETTVRHHLTSIFSKLDVSDRLELVIYAYRNKLIEPPGGNP